MGAIRSGQAGDDSTSPPHALVFFHRHAMTTLCLRLETTANLAMLFVRAMSCFFPPFQHAIAIRPWRSLLGSDFQGLT